MSEPGQPVPDVRPFHFAADTRSVAVLLDEMLYPLDAIYGAAMAFVDRCWVLLDRRLDDRVQVRLRCKTGVATPETMEALAGEFANVLLGQVMRLRVGESTRALREYTVARAFFGDDTRATIDTLLAELDAEELEDDPLEIQVPWSTDE